MAYKPVTLWNGRTQYMKVAKDLISATYGATRDYNGTCTGGASMEALLGPDLGDGLKRGTSTNKYSLQPVVGWLNQYSTRKWVAGHLLNADLGGSGTADENLTALTSGANSNHSTFEDHVKSMLTVCRRIDEYDKGHDSWYGVRYRVEVSATQFAATPDPTDVHSYAYSHITIRYSYRRISKSAGTDVLLPFTDAYYADLTSVPNPVFAGGTTIVGALGGPVQFGPLQIHNT